MSSKNIRGDLNYAWPTAEIAVMGAQAGGGDHLPRRHRRSGRSWPSARPSTRHRFANPFVAASRGYIDDVIMPRDTRKRIVRALKSLRGKKLDNPWKKHDNIPL